MTHFDLSLAESYINQHYLKRETSPCGELYIWNYTDKCTYDKFWNAMTLMCRGLITTMTGEIVARPFPKFFNVGERPETSLEMLANKSDPTITVKEDGSLGILYFWKDKWGAASRGSFISDQAEQANIMLGFYDISNLSPNITYCVEIIYPENRIVMDYGAIHKLIMLASFETISGEEKNTFVFDEKNIRNAQQTSLNLEKCLELAETRPWDEGEGWVARYDCGLRVKIKTKDYLKIHRLKHLSGPLTVWELLKEGTFEEYIVHLPEEFRTSVEITAANLQKQFEEFRDTCLELRDNLGVIDEDISYKERALRIQKVNQKYQGVLFSFMRGRTIDGIIWDKLRPTGNEIQTI